MEILSLFNSRRQPSYGNEIGGATIRAHGVPIPIVRICDAESELFSPIQLEIRNVAKYRGPIGRHIRK
jgi:hypothetical protein